MSRKKTYRFPYTKDNEGYPKLSREMTPKQYSLYKKNIEQMRRGILASCYCSADSEYFKNNRYSVYTTIRHYEVQDTEYYKTLSYPAPGYPERTVASSGEFILMAYMVLKYFNVKDVSVEDLLNIANFGDWHHKNGTWHHFLDVVCETYGIQTLRLSSIRQAMWFMDSYGVAVALLDKSMFPVSRGNCLVFITKIEVKKDKIQYYFPGGPEGTAHLRTCDFKHFFENTKVLWGFSM